jgi:hypothetical protein
VDIAIVSSVGRLGKGFGKGADIGFVRNVGGKILEMESVVGIEFVLFVRICVGLGGIVVGIICARCVAIRKNARVAKIDRENFI